MRSRYAKAAEQVPACALGRIFGNIVEGYWVDDRRFFFLAERRHGDAGDIIALPALADAATGEVRLLVDVDTLAACLKLDDVAALAEASYDLPAPDRLAATLDRRTWLIDLDRRQVLETLEDPEPGLYAPDGRQVAVIRGHDLWLRDRTTGESRPLTRDGALHNAYGQHPENETNPVAYRRRPTPVGLWSADSQWLLTHRIDERDLPQTAIVQHAPAAGGAPVVHSFKLSAWGDPLPIVTPVAIHLATGRRVSGPPIELHAFSPIAMRSFWFCGEATVALIRTDRFRKRLELVEWDLVTGAERTLVREDTVEGYVHLDPVLGDQPIAHILPDSDEAIWWSERDGWGHLYLLDTRSGEVKTQITRGDWLVRGIVHVDAAKRRILFSAGGLDPAAEPGLRHLCAVNFDGSGFETLMSHEGDVAIHVAANGPVGSDRPFRPAFAPRGASPTGSRVVARRTSVAGGATTVIADLEGGPDLILAEARPAGAPPLPFEAVAADGATRLYGLLFLPSDFDPAQTYPLLNFVYPGPQQPWLPRGFGTRSEAQARTFAELGLAVMMADTRHMPLRSRALHQAGYGNQWEPQLADQAALVDQLCGRYAFLDRARVGMIGVSGGGAATALSMFRYPKTYKAGVSVAGNHDSRNYRSVWMDYYVGDVDRSASDHHASRSIADQLRGDLLLVSGDMDDNVPLSQTLELAAALIAADKDFELLIAPNEGHMVLLTSAYVQRRVWDFLVRTLVGAEPPKGFTLTYSAQDKAAYARAAARELAG